MNEIAKSTAVGKNRFEELRSAVIMYSTLTEEDKAAVAENYSLLQDLVSVYNESINNINADAIDASVGFLNVAIISSSALLFGLWGLLTKKFF